MNCHASGRARILLIGLDGASPVLMHRLVSEGELPSLRVILARASLGALESIPPYATPPAWASIYTGVLPAEHGVLDFTDLNADGQLVNSSALRAVPLWRRLSDRGKHAAMIAFPLTYPPPAVNGVIVSGLPAPHHGAVWSHPPELDAGLKAIPHFTPDPEMTSPLANVQQSIERLKAHVRAIGQAALLAHERYGDDGWDLFGVQFQALDTFQHMFWAWIDPDDRRFATRPPSERRLALSFFRALDEVMRDLVEALRPDAIVILSDHGFGPAYEAVCLNPFLLDAGLLRLTIPETSLRASLAAQRIIKRLDLFNLRAHLRFSVRPGAVMTGLNQLRRDKLIDREASVAFAFSGGYCGLIEVKPGFESAVREALLSACHPAHQTPLIKAVHFIGELWDGPWAEAWRQYAIVQPEEGYLIDSHFRPHGAVSPVAAGLTGTHRPTGLLWTTLDALRGAKSILDIAPGILSALGVPHDDLRGNAAEPMTSAALSASEQAAIEERLRRLGYL
ncbi:MAG: alkaline phosphatase family protein [Anaerolineales bacterium]|nr:alkaline phosphatase family protein [Anaerolineales bacterium]